MILGIDTSCYTTSLALVDLKGRLVAEERQLLKVKSGERGLQQSEAVFQHVQNLPRLMDKIFSGADSGLLKAVCASTRPRPVDGSYMPVFTVSDGTARIIARTKGLPFYSASHQEGHIMAGLFSSGKLGLGRLDKNEFLAVHLSGGTSEVLRVTRCETGFQIRILGATGDLHAGQFVDRIGVALGLDFPAGSALENLASTHTGPIPYLPTAVRECNFSFSGPESAAQRLLDQGIKGEAVAKAVEHCIATTLEKVLRRAVAEERLQDILIVGGVASNTYIRERLVRRLEHRAVGARLFFAEPRFSTDNAVGTALLGLAACQAGNQQL